MATPVHDLETAPDTAERRSRLPDRAAATARRASSAAAALWQEVLADLECDPAISRASFATWLRSTQLLDVQGDEFVVGAQHSFALEKLERSFRGAVEQALRRQTGNAAARLRFVVPRAASAAPAQGAAPRPLPLRANEERRTKNEERSATPEERVSSFVPSVGAPLVHYGQALRPSPAAAGMLNPQWTFETFPVGRHNQFAYAAACAVADNPSFAYNPLVVFGPAGAGKTHLLHAIGHRALGLRSGARVTYLPARALAAEWLRCGADAVAFSAVREQHAQVDVLLLDDVHLLPALGPVGMGLQVETARLLAALLKRDAQVVVASQVAPKTMVQLEDALRGRLQAGLVAEIGPRELAPPARVTPLAPVAPANAPPARRRISADDVMSAVAAYFGVPVEALRAKRRDREAVFPRQVAMYLMREETDVSLSEIGARLGGRDHATVLHGYEKVAAQLPNDSGLQADVAAVRQRLGSMVPSAVNLGAPAAAAAAP
jgi:chromosomal replication initiator protein